MLKLYISQPMKGKTNQEIRTERAKIINLAKEKLGGEVEVIDTFFEKEFGQNENKPLWFLGKAIQFMALADVAYFGDGWENSRGCKIEYQCAKEYGILILNNV